VLLTLRNAGIAVRSAGIIHRTVRTPSATTAQRSATSERHPQCPNALRSVRDTEVILSDTEVKRIKSVQPEGLNAFVCFITAETIENYSASFLR